MIFITGKQIFYKTILTHVCRYLIIIILLPISVLNILSCSKYQENWEYQEYILQLTNSDGIEIRPLFSFDYPMCFQVVITFRRNEWGVTRIQFTKGGVGRFENQTLLRLSISDYPINEFGTDNLSTIVLDRISELSNSHIEEFQLIERRIVSISEIKGEYFHYSYIAPPPLTAIPSEEVVQELWFLYDNYYWQLYFIYGPEYDERNFEDVGKVFLHIIESFEILD